MDKLFRPKVRDRAVETTCSNLMMAGLLLPCEVAKYVSVLSNYTDSQLAEVLVTSRMLYDGALEGNASRNRN